MRTKNTTILNSRSHANLDDDHSGDDPFEVGIRSHQLLNLWIFGEDFLSSRGVRLLRVGPFEVMTRNRLTHDKSLLTIVWYKSISL